MVSYLDFGPFSNMPWKENPCYLIFIWPVNISHCWESLLEVKKRGLTIIIVPTTTISHYRWIKEIAIILLFESKIFYTLWMNELPGNFKMMRYSLSCQIISLVITWWDITFVIEIFTYSVGSTFFYPIVRITLRLQTSFNLQYEWTIL